MTSVVEQRRAAHARPRATSGLGVSAGDVAGIGGTLLALIYLAHGQGGRSTRELSVTIAVLAVALAVVRAWRLPWVQLLLAGWLGAAGVATAFVHGSVNRDHSLVAYYRWPAAGGYVVAAAAFLLVSAYATDTRRRVGIAAAIAIAGAIQFAWALVAWWGGEDPSLPMVGTFYWYNQFAAFLIAPALLGLALAVAGRPPWRLVGAIAAVLSATGIVYSTSRATMACAAAGWLVLGCLALRSAKPRAALARWVAISLLAVVAIIGISGPPLFSHRADPFAGSSARSSSGEGVTGDGLYRTEFMREAIAATVDHPVTGIGYGNLASVSLRRVPTSWARSTLAHNGVLQAFADGGVVLGLPVLAATLALAGLAVGAVWRGLRRRDLMVGAAATALLALLAHALVDTDWSYPALFALFAIVGGLVVSRRRA